MKPLAPPTMKERAAAAIAARALRAAIADSSTMGARIDMHILLSRPRRGEWWVSWENLPGFVRCNGSRYFHTLLPGWEYTRAEVISEMIPDLETLAEKGWRPTEDTSATRLL